MANHRAKGTKNLGIMGKYLVPAEYLSILVFKFSLGSFVAFPIFADPVYVVSRKRLIVEQNGPKFQHQR